MLLVCTLGLLASCNNNNTSPTSDVRRVPDLEAQLPPERDMQAKVGSPRLKAQAISTLPAWTGPRTYGGFFQYSPQLAVSNAGDVVSLNSQASTGGVYPNYLRVWNSTGTSIGEYGVGGEGRGGRLAIDKTFSSGFDSPPIWVLRRTGGLNDTSYTLSTYSRSIAGEAILSPRTKTLQLINYIASTEAGGEAMENNRRAGIAFMDAPPAYQHYVNVIEASYTVGQQNPINRTTPVLFPKNLTGFDAERVQKDFSVGDESVFYIVMAFPATGCTDVACPSLMNVQQIKNGVVQWSRVWKTTQPVKLRSISANKNDVAILMNINSANPDSIAAQSQITWVRNDGVVSLRARIPLELWRRDWTTGTPEQQYALIPNLQFIQTDDNGRLLLNSGNVIMSGTFNDGLSNIYLLNHKIDPATDLGTIGSRAVFNGDYVYAGGTTTTNFGNPIPDVNNDKLFLLPLDFQLNER